MPSLITIPVLFVAILSVLAWGHLGRLPHWLRATTLLPAGWWAVGAGGLWFTTWGFDYLARLLSKPVADHLWYACAVISLCPPIAVLGSRRPGARVWTWFILIPMLFALGWPVITLLIQGSDIRGLQLETPQLVGYLLVLVMGTGNYIGTRYTFPAMLYGVANTLLVVSSSAVASGWLIDRSWSRIAAMFCMSFAVLLAGGSAAAGTTIASGFDRLWLDFFDQFGVVWGRRIQDRVNFMAAKEGWPARLELHGFKWDTTPDSATEARIEHTFRWLLRRFVDPAWIDARLGSPRSTEDITPLGADS